jgi:hypothetical protein
VIIENYGRHLRSRGKSILSEERKRVRPFETSLLDGIDLRETIRNWHSGNIYVQELLTVKGSVDSLVVIYDEEDSKYPYTMTWLGEHYQESDMAFYATDPAERVIGPGIQKAVYGGFLMTMPPGRLFDVFHDPAYNSAQNHAERLLMAAIDYGLESLCCMPPPNRPGRFFRSSPDAMGSEFTSPGSAFSRHAAESAHVSYSGGKSVRDYAGDYIW